MNEAVRVALIEVQAGLGRAVAVLGRLLAHAEQDEEADRAAPGSGEQEDHAAPGSGEQEDHAAPGSGEEGDRASRAAATVTIEGRLFRDLRHADQVAAVERMRQSLLHGLFALDFIVVHRRLDGHLIGDARREFVTGIDAAEAYLAEDGPVAPTDATSQSSDTTSRSG